MSAVHAMSRSSRAGWWSLPMRSAGRRAAVAEGLEEMVEGRAASVKLAEADAASADCAQRIAACVEKMRLDVARLADGSMDPDVRVGVAYSLRSAARDIQELSRWQQDLELYRSDLLGERPAGSFLRGLWRRSPASLRFPRLEDYTWDFYD